VSAAPSPAVAQYDWKRYDVECPLRLGHVEEGGIARLQQSRRDAAHAQPIDAEGLKVLDRRGGTGAQLCGDQRIGGFVGCIVIVVATTPMVRLQWFQLRLDEERIHVSPRRRSEALVTHARFGPLEQQATVLGTPLVKTQRLFQAGVLGGQGGDVDRLGDSGRRDRTVCNGRRWCHCGWQRWSMAVGKGSGRWRCSGGSWSGNDGCDHSQRFIRRLCCNGSGTCFALSFSLCTAAGVGGLQFAVQCLEFGPFAHDERKREGNGNETAQKEGNKQTYM
jgi:hypothetical protein